MNNIIPFESAKLPAHLAAVDVAALNADLTAHAGGGFPVISIKSKNFTIVKDGTREILMNPKDPESAATSLEVILIKANRNTSKVFYAAGYDPQQPDGAKPDCYSGDGTSPAADALNPQSKTCATCKHNQWGSKVTEKGNSKGKACQDVVRLAVAPAGETKSPHLLRVPPASIRNLGEYGQVLAKRGVGYNMVVTKIAFDVEAESPKLTFKPIGFLDAAAYAEVVEMASSDLVDRILDSSPTTGASDAPEEPTKAAEPPAEKPAAVAPATTKTKPAAKTAKAEPAPKAEPAAATVVDEDPELDLSGIDFDD